MSVKLLAEHRTGFLGLEGGFAGPPGSALVRMSHCWRSRVTTHIIIV